MVPQHTHLLHTLLAPTSWLRATDPLGTHLGCTILTGFSFLCKGKAAMICASLKLLQEASPLEKDSSCSSSSTPLSFPPLLYSNLEEEQKALYSII